MKEITGDLIKIIMVHHPCGPPDVSMTGAVGLFSINLFGSITRHATFYVIDHNREGRGEEGIFARKK